MGGMLPGVIPPTSCINKLLCRYSGTNHVVILLDKGGAGRGRMRCTAAARVQANLVCYSMRRTGTRKLDWQSVTVISVTGICTECQQLS